MLESGTFSTHFKLGACFYCAWNVTKKQYVSFIEELRKSCKDMAFEGVNSGLKVELLYNEATNSRLWHRICLQSEQTIFFTEIMY